MVAQTDSQSLNLSYEGSVKRLWTTVKDSKKLYFDFTDDYSVFDWGKMPDTIKNKGKSLTIMGAFFFEELSKANFWKQLKNSKNLSSLDKNWLENHFESSTFKNLIDSGLKHHYHGLFDGQSSITLDSIKSAGSLSSLYLEVMKAEVNHPESGNLNSTGLYFYPDKAPSKNTASLIPLEVVFRFGMPQGSSLKDRLKSNPNYYRELGLEEEPQEGKLFDRPVIEFFTKLEATDRFLSWQEAIEISRLDRRRFESLLNHTYSIALALFEIFAKHNITLYDGKLEFIQVTDDDGTGEIYLADSIGPDELRLIYKGHHLSKELVRQYYQGSSWCEALSKAKAKTKLDPKVDFKTRCISEFNQSPKPIEDDAKELIDMLYPAIANTICQKEYFADIKTLDQLVESFNSVFSHSEAS